MREELEHHIELRTEDLMREGLSATKAKRQAHRESVHVENRARRRRALDVTASFLSLEGGDDDYLSLAGFWRYFPQLNLRDRVPPAPPVRAPPE